MYIRNRKWQQQWIPSTTYNGFCSIYSVWCTQQWFVLLCDLEFKILIDFLFHQAMVMDLDLQFRHNMMHQLIQSKLKPELSSFSHLLNHMVLPVLIQAQKLRTVFILTYPKQFHKDMMPMVDTLTKINNCQQYYLNSYQVPYSYTQTTSNSKMYSIFKSTTQSKCLGTSGTMSQYDIFSMNGVNMQKRISSVFIRKVIISDLSPF